jgi:Acetyl esterase (deacetylase)
VSLPRRQVEDTRNALTFLAQHPAVDPARIGVIGSSFGGAVAIYTGGVDARVAAVISNGGWGDGERKFRGQHKSPQEWARFTQCSRRAASTAPAPASR